MEVNNYTGQVGACAASCGKVSEFLLEDGYHVIDVDNMNNAYDIRLKQWRFDQIKDNSNFQFRKIDICDRKSLIDLLTSHHLSLDISVFC